MTDQAPVQTDELSEFTISRELSDALIGYLEQQPYREAAPFILGLQQSYQQSLAAANGTAPAEDKVEQPAPKSEDPKPKE